MQFQDKVPENLKHTVRNLANKRADAEDMGKFLIAAALWTLLAVNSGRGDDLLPDATVIIQQRPHRCVGQLCLPIPKPVSMKYNDWKLKFSANVDPSLPSRASPVIAPAGHGWSFYFHFPETTHRSQSIYYEITTASPILTQGWYVKMAGRVSPSPPGLDCRMYFQEVSALIIAGSRQSL